MSGSVYKQYDKLSSLEEISSCPDFISIPIYIFTKRNVQRFHLQRKLKTSNLPFVKTMNDLHEKI